MDRMHKFASTPECNLDTIPLVYNTANLIGVDPSMRIPLCTIFLIDLAILQKYYVLTLES